MSWIFRRNSNASSTGTANVVFEAKVDAGPASSELIGTPPDSLQVTARQHTDEEHKLIEDLREYTTTLLLPETHEYHRWERRFLADPGMHPRYMRAGKWDLEDAKKRIKATIEWRREYRPELIPPAEVAPEQETGKLVASGFDKEGRTILYMTPSRQNTEDSPRQIRHTVYFLERAIDLMPPNQEQVTLVIDYKDMSRVKQPSTSTGRTVLSVLQDHYVERLGKAYVMNVPWWLNAFYVAISPFIDPVSRDKLRFNPTLTDFIEPEQLEVRHGGSYHFEYDHAVYWPMLNEFCRIGTDGSRFDDTGRPWVPPAGMGIVDALAERHTAIKDAAAP